MHFSHPSCACMVQVPWTCMLHAWTCATLTLANATAMQPVTWKAAPRGSKECPKTEWGQCNGVGVCNADWGRCECPGRCCLFMPESPACSVLAYQAGTPASILVRTQRCGCSFMMCWRFWCWGFGFVTHAAGWAGPNCGTRHLRPCTANTRGCDQANEPPYSHIDENG